MADFQLSSAYIVLLTSCAVLSSETQQHDDYFINSALDNYILYFDEWRFDWDDTNDFDTNYDNDALFGCTHNLQTIDKQLCVWQTKDGDFTFRFKNSKENINKKSSYNSHSNMVSAAKQLSDYYNNIELKFDDDNFWSGIQSIDGIHGYEAIKKCQPFIFMELCAIYNPYADNLNVHIKLANFKKRRISSKYPFKKSKISNANDDYYDIDDEGEGEEEEEQLSIGDAISLAMKDYDDTLSYSHWRGNELGFDKFDERNPTKSTLRKDDDNNDDDELNKASAAHTYYFNTLSFDWDDSRDWISFSKQTTPAANTEEVGAHPDKLEEVGAHPKQSELVSVGPAKDTGAKTSAADSAPSRSFTKCTGAIPFIHKHACVTVGSHDAHLQLTSATEQEINILYNGLSDILNEIDIDEQDASQQEQASIDQAWSEINDVYEEYDDDDDYDDYDGGRRRLQSIYDRDDAVDDDEDKHSDLQFSFNDDNHWDEIINSYGFEHDNENNYGRFGHRRAKNDHTDEADDGISAAVGNMINNLNVNTLRPKLMHKTVPFLFPAIIKCVHTKIVRLCLAMDVHKKAVKLHVMMPHFAPMFKCVRNSMHCNPYRLQTGKRIFNGVKKGMALIRSVGRRNPYKKTKKHLRKAMKQIRRIKKVLKHLTRQIKKTLRQFSASETDENLYDDNDEEDASMAQKVFDATDERGLLFYAQKGTNDFNDIWDDDNQWNAIQDMTAWDGRGIRRKCLTIWRKRLCLCQFLGWLDGPEKYHCLFPHHEEFNGYDGENDNDLYDNVQIKNVNPQLIVHHFHHISAAKQIESNMRSESDAIYPSVKPNWIPLWMWQEIKSRAQNEQISKLLYSAHDEQYSDYDDVYNDDNDDDETYDNKDYYDQYRAALDDYYDNSELYDDVEVEDMVNLNDIYAENNEEQDEEQLMKHDAWIEMSESATHDFDTEWNNDEHWDEISDIKTWEGTSIKRKCLHLWKHRLCLCQFLGWMDTNKYKCIYHHRTRSPLAQQRYNTVHGHESDTKKSPNIIFHDRLVNEGGPVIHHYVPIHHYQTPTTHAPPTYTVIHRYGPYHGRVRRARKRKIINFVPQRPIHWNLRRPIVVHHFHHVVNDHHGAPVVHGHGAMHGVHGIHGAIHGVHGVHETHGAMHGVHGMRGADSSVGDLLRSRSRSRSRSASGSGSEDEEEDEAQPRGGYNSLQRRWYELKKREKKERKREKKFKDLLWSDRHSHKMWKLMKQPHKPIFGNTVTGQHVIARQINPHGKPLMVSMHKHMPSHRPQWMPQGLFTNLKHKLYYMVHAHKKGDHSTVTGDENRFVHGSDIVSAQTQQYDVYDNYYYYDANEISDELYDDEYDDTYYYNTEYDTLFDFDAIYEKYNDEKYEDEAFDQNKYLDEFVDDWNDEWVVSDLVNALESAFYNLFDSGDSDKYWEDLNEFETKKGKLMDKKCLNIFNKMKCLCQYHATQHHYHCHKKNIHRHKFYLNSLMPKETPQWMSAHDFDWLKDQRLSAFTELLPDPLMQHIEYNDLFSIPFNALSLLVHPAVKMEHINWHKDDYNNDNAGDISSAHRTYDNVYGSVNWNSDDIYANEESLFSNGYVNEYGDYIIDEFYNELDGTKWVVTNEWTNDLNDVWQNEDEMQVFSASTEGTKTGGGKTKKKTNNVETDAARTLSSKCMLVFGREVCLCEFINWVYDHSGTNPLYRCYSSETSSIQPQNSNINNNVGNNNNAGTNNVNRQRHRAQVLNKLKTLEQTVMETGKKIDELVSKQGAAGGGAAAGGTSSQSMPKEGGGGENGWGSKIDNYGYDNEYMGYSEYDDNDVYDDDDDALNEYEVYDNYGYDNDDDDDEDIGSAYAYINDDIYNEDNDDIHEEDDSVYDGYDAFYDALDADDDINENDYDENRKEEEEEENGNKDTEKVQPNWWTEGDGFTQRVYIGTNTFWGLILLSIFFGMIACSVVCGYFHLQKIFCRNNKMSIACTPPLKMYMEDDERDPFQLAPIDEDKM